MPKIIIAIDGYSSCGKSTTAKKIANYLGYKYIDTGAMYRAITLFFLQKNILLTSGKAIKDALDVVDISFQFNRITNQNEIYLNDKSVESEIRKLYVANSVSEVSAIAEVRRVMVALQQKLGQKGGVVLDGRDIGTIVFPKAELKIFMTADAVIRAKRRQVELIEKGEIIELNDILENINKRDHLDTTRTEGPLCRSMDALLLDTSFMTIDEQVEWIIKEATKKMAGPLEVV